MPLEMVVVSSVEKLPKAPREQFTPYLYVIEFGPVVKVGISRDPYRRALNLRTGSGRQSGRAAYAGPFTYAYRAEKTLLNRFPEGRIVGSEWIEAAFEDVLEECATVECPLPTAEDLEEAKCREKRGDAFLGDLKDWFSASASRNEEIVLAKHLYLILPVIISEIENRVFKCTQRAIIKKINEDLFRDHRIMIDYPETDLGTDPVAIQDKPEFLELVQHLVVEYLSVLRSGKSDEEPA